MSPPAPVIDAQRERIPRFDRPMVAAVEKPGRGIDHAGQQVVRQDFLPVLVRPMAGPRRAPAGRDRDRERTGMAATAR